MSQSPVLPVRPETVSVAIPGSPVVQAEPDKRSPAASDGTLLARAREVIEVEREALEDIQRQLDENFARAVTLLETVRGRVIVTGMGKSGLIGKKIAATLSSTGTPASFLHPAEGSHGDLGILTRQDVVIAISNSGETPEILGLLPLIKRFGLPLVALTGKPDSTLGRQADCILNIAVRREACPLGLAPTASTTATLAMGDALAVVLLERRGFSEEDFALFHPAGSLGKRLLLRVRDIMHSGDALPLVCRETSFLDALVEVSLKKLGLAIVTDEAGRMIGVLTDGDVRRALTRFADPRDIRLAEVMTPSPKSIDPDELAVTALHKMEEHQITVLVSCGPDGRPTGAVHLHDLLKAGLV